MRKKKKVWFLFFFPLVSNTFEVRWWRYQWTCGYVLTRLYDVLMERETEDKRRRVQRGWLNAEAVIADARGIVEVAAVAALLGYNAHE